MIGNATEQRFVIHNHALAAATPRQNRSLFQGLLLVGHNQSWIKNEFLAEPMTHRAGAKGRIERKMFGLGLLVTQASSRAVHTIRVKRLNPARWRFSRSLRNHQ